VEEVAAIKKKIHENIKRFVNVEGKRTASLSSLISINLS
jgi:hypothetical protein